MDCAGCGNCCEVVWTNFDRARLDEMLELAVHGRGGMVGQSATDAMFYATHFHALDPETATSGSVDADAARAAGMSPWVCDAFDPATRLCTAHDERPSMCSGYPWYLGYPWGYTEPDAERAHLPAGCSHRWDLPVGDRGPVERRLLPLWPV